MFFLSICQRLNERKIFFEFEFEPVFQPEATLTC